MEPRAPKRRKLTRNVSQDSSSLSEAEDIVYAGRISRLQMVNFMCHSNLEIKFNPRINFITGRNGSGKSAVMAALVVVLGGTAVNTGRGRGVSDFIKKGETKGKVTIDILNEGINAYKPEEYGDLITIVRSFTTTGVNSYSLRSASGGVISKKKTEVDKICEFLRLEIKNPICVLNQDVARSFLTSSDSKLRFELFMNATQLRQLERLHDETVSQLSTSRNDLERKTQLLVEAQKEVKELEKKLKYWASLEKVTEERRNLENEFVWAGVIADEKAIEELKKERQLMEEKVKGFEEALHNHKTRVNDLEEEANHIKLDLIRVQSKMKLTSEEKKTVYAEYLRLQGEATKQETQLSLSLPKLNRTLGDIKRVEEYIQEIDLRNSQMIANQAKISDEIREAKQELKSIQERFAPAERDLENANETKMKTQEELSEITSNIRNLELNKSRKAAQLEGMRGQEDLEALKFGPYVPRLLEAIDDAHRRRLFKHKPVGPLGMHIKLNDLKWADAVESVIGGLMTAFCCDNDKDFKVLSQIMEEKVGQKQPSVIISKFQPQKHDVSQHRVKVHGLSTILDVLTFNNDTVFNTIIDQAGIEGILLFERDEQAATMMTHVENVPKNLRMGVTKASDRYYPAPNYRTYAGRSRTQFFNQSTNREDVICKLERELSGLDNEIESQRVLVRKHRDTMAKMDDFVTRSKQRLSELRKRKMELELALSRLQDQEESRPVPRTKLALEEELLILTKEKEECEKERALKMELKKKAEAEMTIVKEKLNDVNRRIDKLQNEINKLEEDLGKNQEAKSSLAFLYKNSDSQMKKLQEQMTVNNKKQIEVGVDLEQSIRDAESICPNRVETNRRPDEIIKLLEQKDKYLKAAEKIAGSREDVIAQYQEKMETFKEKNEMKEAIEQDITYMANCLANRMNLFNERVKLSAQEVAYYFRASLLTRGYDGVLQFDIDGGKLELKVRPRANDASDDRTDSKTLSGGERSYSTVSFVLAMWRAVVMPFYFLDEFDVFMDKVNRRVVMDLLLQYATEKTKTQFVFITPQDISSVVANDYTSIYKMPDPERNKRSD